MSTERTLGFKELFAMALGTVIGAGVITLIGSAVGVTGRSAWLAFVLAVVVGFLYALPYLMASSVIRLQGGLYSLVGTVLGKRWAGVFVMAYTTRMLQFSLFGLGIGQYINSIIPAFPPKAVGIVVILGIFLLNLSNINGIARVQKVISWILIISLGLFIIIGLFNLNYNPFDFSSEGFFTNGAAGVMDAIVILVFSTQGYYLIINLSGFAKSPRTHIPKIMFIMPVILLFVYGGAGMVAGCVLPLEEVANKPLTYVAQAILPTPLLYVFIFGGACMALLSTLNGLFSTYGSVYGQGTKDGWFPKIMSQRNKNGQPIVIYAIAALVGILPILFDFNIRQVTNNIMLLTPFSDALPIIAICLLPKKYPEGWKSSIVHMPRPLFIGIMVICIITQAVVAYWSALGLTVTAIVVSLLVIAFCVVYGLIRARNENVSAPDLSEAFAE